MAEGQGSNRERTLEFLNDEITRQNDQLLRSAEAIDTKATFIAGVAAAVVTFLLANRRGWLWAAALVLYGLCFALAAASLRPRRWAGLVPGSLRQLSGADHVFVVGRVAGSKVAVFERNHGLAESKMRFWVASVLALGAGTIVLVISTLAEGVHHG